MFYRFYCTALECGICREVWKATWCVRSVVHSTYSANSLHRPRHRPGIVRTRTVQPPVTQTIMARRLRFFGHIVRSDSDEDQAGPQRWHRRPAEGLGTRSPRLTWLRTIENDLKQQNLGLWSARHRAYDRKRWREIVETVTLLQGHATWWWWWWILIG